MNKIRNYWKNKKGITLVWGAFFLIVLLVLAGMAIDIAYMYVAKNQLQVAADAGSLAGAALLSNTTDPAQTLARLEAITFCGKNTAAGSPVSIASNDSNTLSNTNDITVGFFNYSTRIYTSHDENTLLAVNAIQVRSRRTANSPSGPVSVFLGKVMGWNLMSAASIAVAGRPPKPALPIGMCVDTCDSSILPLPTFFHFKPEKSPTPQQVVTWTNMSTTTQSNGLGPNQDVAAFLTGTLAPDVCCQKIYTNTGVGYCANTLLPNVFDQHTQETGLPYWDVIVPIFGLTPGVCIGQTISQPACPPDYPPLDPAPVSRYARVRITSVVGSGEDPGIHVSEIECFSCPANELYGTHPVLLK
jgi:Flp pilus assembly protein TadG